MNINLLAATISISMLVTNAANAQTYNALKQFKSKNPTGPWAYGYGTTGTSFTIYGSYSTNVDGLAGFDVWSTGSPPPLVGANKSNTTYVYNTALIPKLQVIMHPGVSMDSILEWTAPVAGTFQFSGFYEILDESPTGIAALIFDNATNITHIAFNGGSGILTGPGANLNTDKPGGKEKFAFSLTVAAGDIISFGLNNDGNYDNDTTGVTVIIKGEASANVR